MSWIHIDDLAALYVAALTDDKFKGVYNGTAPEPVRMADLCRSLGAAMNRPSWLPVPEFALQVRPRPRSCWLSTPELQVCSGFNNAKGASPLKVKRRACHLPERCECPRVCTHCSQRIMRPSTPCRRSCACHEAKRGAAAGPARRGRQGGGGGAAGGARGTAAARLPLPVCHRRRGDGRPLCRRVSGAALLLYSQWRAAAAEVMGV